MIKLNFPEYHFKIKSKGETHQIFDIVRKKYVILTPEEWVRQNYIQYMIKEYNYPQQLLSIEKSIELHGMKVRPDIVAYSNNGNPVVIVECKAPTVKITQDTFDQIAKYNIRLRLNYLAVTNGLEHYYCEIDFQKNSYSFIPDLPNYKEL